MSSGSISFLFCTSWCNWYRIAKEIISKFDLEKGSKPGILPIGMYLFWSSWSTFTGVDGLRDPQDILDETSATGHHSRRVSRVEPAELQSGSPSATLDLVMVHVMRTRMVPQTKHKYKRKKHTEKDTLNVFDDIKDTNHCYLEFFAT